jgi:(2Fe-2S) ferredoxin
MVHRELRGYGDAVPGRHLFVCTNGRSSGKPACGPRGGDALVAAVQRELLARRPSDPSVMVTACECLGPCFDGPNAVVYPDGIWYGGLTPADATNIADHLVDGTPFTAKQAPRPGAARDD